MSTNAFTPLGNTVTFLAAVSAPTPVQVVASTLGGGQYRIINNGSVTVFLGFGTTASQATNNAVVVTSSQASIPLLPGTDEVLTFVPNAYFTGVTASGNATIYITNGDGM
jgi:hypothetical protein